MCIDINNQNADFNLTNNLSLGYEMFLLHIKKTIKNKNKNNLIKAEKAKANFKNHAGKTETERNLTFLLLSGKEISQKVSW